MAHLHCHIDIAATVYMWLSTYSFLDYGVPFLLFTACAIILHIFPRMWWLFKLWE